MKRCTAIVAACALASASAVPVVHTEYGPVAAVMREGGVAAFYKVPFAASTAGDARWRPASAPETWTEPIEQANPPATDGGCLQVNPSFDPGSASSSSSVGIEDCLFSYVYSPLLPSAHVQPKAPVYVWWHGGAFVIGNGWQNGGGGGTLDGAALANKFGIVVVSMQYRLGALGLLALPAIKAESDDGSFGSQMFLDQRFGLQWIKRNIARFGGDPDRVVIGGQSAGAYSVCWHLASPMSRGLFVGGIMESGGCDTNIRLSKAVSNALSYAASVGCPDGPSQLACLRKKDSASLLNASDPFIAQHIFTQWPVVDGSASGLPDTQLRLLRAGHGSVVPLLIGHNSDEFQVGCLKNQSLHECYSVSYFVQGGATPNSSLDLGIIDLEATIFGLDVSVVDKRWKEVLAKYPLGDYSNSESQRLSSMFTDIDWESPNGEGEGGSFSIGPCETLRAARANAVAGAPTYMYQYDFHTDALGLSKQVVGHCDELPFTFQTDAALANPATAGVAELLGLYWSSFIKHLDPNGNAAVTEWPELGTSGELLRIPGPTPLVERPRREAFCEFWQDLMVEQPSPATREQLADNFPVQSDRGALAMAVAAIVAAALVAGWVARQTAKRSRGDTECHANQVYVAF